VLKLHGQRYIPGADPDLVQFVAKELHYLDFDTTLRWYDHVSKCLDALTLNLDDLAFLGCNDRYFLLTAILQRKDMLHPWLFDRCREVEAEPDGYLDLWGRFHYKSTIITYGGTIQDIIRDPDMTQAIFSVTQGNAERFLKQIKETLERNELLKKIYADCLYQHPKKESPRWAIGTGIQVKRSPNNTKKEPTVGAHGLVEGLPAGPHYEKLLYDDVVTQKSVTNPEQIEKVSMHEEMSDNLGVESGARKQYVGTRYRHGDTYQQIIDRGDVKVRIYPTTDNGKLNGNPVFLTPKRWDEIKRTQKKVVASQHLMNPAAGNEASFDPLTFRPYTIRPALLNVYIMCDPSSGRTQKSDRTAIAVIGVDVQKNFYLLDGYRHRMSLTKRWEALHGLYEHWYHVPGVRSIGVGYERYGMQADLQYFELEMLKKGNLSFPIEELNWPREGEHSKTARVDRLEPYLRNSKFWLPGLVWHADFSDMQNGLHTFWSINPDSLEIEYRRQMGDTKAMKAMKATNQSWRVVKPIIRYDEDRNVYDVTRALLEELRFFPFGSHDDLVDATSRIFDMDWVAPEPFERDYGEEIRDEA